MQPLAALALALALLAAAVPRPAAGAATCASPGIEHTLDESNNRFEAPHSPDALAAEAALQAELARHYTYSVDGTGAVSGFDLGNFGVGSVAQSGSFAVALSAKSTNSAGSASGSGNTLTFNGGVVTFTFTQAQQAIGFVIGDAADAGAGFSVTVTGHLAGGGTTAESVTNQPSNNVMYFTIVRPEDPQQWVTSLVVSLSQATDGAWIDELTVGTCEPPALPSCASPGAVAVTDSAAANAFTFGAAPEAMAARMDFLAQLGGAALDGLESSATAPAGAVSGTTLQFGAFGTATLSNSGSSGAARVDEAGDFQNVGTDTFTGRHIAMDGGTLTVTFSQPQQAFAFAIGDAADSGTGTATITATLAGGGTDDVFVSRRVGDGVLHYSTIRSADPDDHVTSVSLALSQSTDAAWIDEFVVGACSDSCTATARGMTRVRDASANAVLSLPSSPLVSQAQFDFMVSLGEAARDGFEREATAPAGAVSGTTLQFGALGTATLAHAGGAVSASVVDDYPSRSGDEQAGRLVYFQGGVLTITFSEPQQAVGVVVSGFADGPGASYVATANLVGGGTDTISDSVTPSFNVEHLSTVRNAGDADDWVTSFSLSVSQSTDGGYLAEVAVGRCACSAEALASAVVELVPGPDALPDTGIDGDDLVVSWTVPARFDTAAFAFVGGAASCGVASDLLDAGGPTNNNAAVWSVPAEQQCSNKFRFTRPLADSLKDCNFEGPTRSGNLDLFSATVEATTFDADGGVEVFGTNPGRTETTSFALQVAFPVSVEVTSGDVQAFPGFAGLEVDGRSFAVVSTQAYNVDSETFTLRVITAVAWPYVLELDGTTPVARSSGSNTWTLGASFQGGDCDSGAAVDNVCVQQWDLTLAHISDCEVDGEYDLNFDVRCSDAFGNGDGCETHENPTAKVTIPIESDSVCARVVEVATVTPTLVTSTSQGGAQATDFVLQTTLYGRVSVAAEGGVATTAVVLTDLEIDSDCSSCAGSDGDKRNPFSDASPLASTYSWSTTPGVTFADFEFQLNANSVPFDTGAGQASITLTATVAVTYDEAGDQRTETRRVQLQAGGETVAARATANFGVGSTPGAAGGSSSTAGSTVLGVSTGTAMVAAVGLVAVVAIAAGVAVTRRNRAASAGASAKRVASATASTSAAASLQLQGSSSANDLSLEVLPTADLQAVQGAYESTA